MAREYGKTFGKSFQNPGLRALSEDARHLFRYLCASTHSNAAGVYVLPLAYAADDLQWGMERVKEGFRNLYAKPFVTYDEPNQMVFIPGWWNQNQIENRNVAKHVAGLINSLPPCAVKSHAINNLARYAASLPDNLKGGQINEAKRTLVQEFGNPCDTPLQTLPEPFRTIEPEPEPEPVVRRLEGSSVSQLELSRASETPNPVSASPSRAAKSEPDGMPDIPPNLRRMAG